MPERIPLLLTRPAAQSGAFAAALEAALPGRFEPVIAPLIEIRPEAGPVALDGAVALVFSSANGVEAFVARSAERGLPAFCVGRMTAEAARREGFAAESADGDVEALARLVAAGYRPGSGDVVHVRGTRAAGDLIGRLSRAGVPARALRLYDQAAVPLAPEAAARLAAGGVPALAFFSPRTAALFAAATAAEGWNLSGATAFSLSPAVDAALRGIGFGVRRVAAEPSRSGMIAALAEG